MLWIIWLTTYVITMRKLLIFTSKIRLFNQARGWGVEEGWGTVIGSSTKTAFQKGKQRDNDQKRLLRC